MCFVLPFRAQKWSKGDDATDAMTSLHVLESEFEIVEAVGLRSQEVQVEPAGQIEVHERGEVLSGNDGPAVCAGQDLLEQETEDIDRDESGHLHEPDGDHGSAWAGRLERAGQGPIGADGVEGEVRTRRGDAEDGG